MATALKPWPMRAYRSLTQRALIGAALLWGIAEVVALQLAVPRRQFLRKR
jgi:hypothetical protein